MYTLINIHRSVLSLVDFYVIPDTHNQAFELSNLSKLQKLQPSDGNCELPKLTIISPGACPPPFQTTRGHARCILVIEVIQNTQSIFNAPHTRETQETSRAGWSEEWRMCIFLQQFITNARSIARQLLLLLLLLWGRTSNWRRLRAATTIRKLLSLFQQYLNDNCRTFRKRSLDSRFWRLSFSRG